VKEYDKNPLMALLIKDCESNRASLNCNIYPLDNNKRGLIGKHKLHIAKRFFPDQFSEYANYFNDFWNGAESIGAIESFIENKGR